MVTDAEKRRKGEEQNTEIHRAKARAHAASGGGAITKAAEVRAQHGGGIHPWVDPRTHDVHREARTVWKQLPSGLWVMEYGRQVLAYKQAVDTTGSMGHYVDLAYKLLPEAYDFILPLLTPRYHVQMATAIVQDINDRQADTLVAHLHSEYEASNRIDDELAMMVPMRAGGDPAEEYQLDVWYTAYRTTCDLFGYGLKGYYFVVGDERGRDYVDARTLKYFYGQDLSSQGDISLSTLRTEIHKHWHPFFLQLGDQSDVSRWWKAVFGPEHVISLFNPDHMILVQAAIVALTEGICDLQSVGDFLVHEAGMSRQQAGMLVRSVAHIPVGAQAALPNFSRLPVGDTLQFQNKGDLWPAGSEQQPASASTANPRPSVRGTGGRTSGGWKL